MVAFVNFFNKREMMNNIIRIFTWLNIFKRI